MIARSPSRFGAPSCAMRGMAKAAVLPEPVGAHATTSRLAIIEGTACICTRVSSW